MVSVGTTCVEWWTIADMSFVKRMAHHNANCVIPSRLSSEKWYLQSTLPSSSLRKHDFTAVIKYVNHRTPCCKPVKQTSFTHFISQTLNYKSSKLIYSSEAWVNCRPLPEFSLASALHVWSPALSISVKSNTVTVDISVKIYPCWINHWKRAMGSYILI